MPAVVIGSAPAGGRRGSVRGYLPVDSLEDVADADMPAGVSYDSGGLLGLKRRGLPMGAPSLILKP